MSRFITATLLVAVVATASLLIFAPTSTHAAAECKEDLDCVKATCCHAGFCVSKDRAPKCAAEICSTDCVPFTTDCGGGCVCDKTMGKCEAHFGEANLTEHHGHLKHKKYAYFKAKVGPGFQKHGRNFHG